MRVGPKVELNSVHPCTEGIRPQYLHLKLILSILTKLPLSPCTVHSTNELGYQHDSVLLRRMHCTSLRVVPVSLGATCTCEARRCDMAAPCMDIMNINASFCQEHAEFSGTVMRLTLDNSAFPSLLTESALQLTARCIRGLS